MNYLKVAAIFAIAFAVNVLAPGLLTHIAQLVGTEAAIASTLWCLGLFLVFGWMCSKASEGTLFPSFTLQLLIGIVLHDALQPLSVQLVLAVVVCTALAALILKSGGDEIDRKAFLAIAWPTFMIAVVGYGITFFVMFPLLMWLGLSGPQAALLSAIIGSTDPAALIPTLKHLMFKHVYQRVVNVSVAESALNDAVGAIFTAAVADMVLDKSPMDSVEALSQTLFSPHNVINLGQQFLFGCVAGLVGWIAMQAYDQFRSREHQRGIAHPAFDFALLLFIPLATFLLAQMLHGNGFLAAFVAGLLANFNHKHEYFHAALQHTETHIESLAKPVIFMMVGPFVSLSDLADTAILGLAVSIIFIFIARPVAVLVSLLPTNISLKEKLFLCAVRETGVIPVVLAVITVAQFPDLKLMMPLTAWTVIWTLSFLPAVTPWWSERLGLIEKKA